MRRGHGVALSDDTDETFFMNDTPTAGTPIEAALKHGPIRGVGFVRGSPGGRIEIVRHMNEADWAKSKQALASLARLDQSFGLELTQKNLSQLRQTFEFASVIASFGRRFPAPDRRLAMRSILTALMNYLTSFRLYLDHEELRLKRMFGKHSVEVERFVSATTGAYDSSLGYRFSYKLRNYFLHCAVPAFSFSVRNPDAPENPELTEVTLMLGRDELLANFKDGWGTVRADLRAMDEHFAVLPLIEQSMTALVDVAREVTEIDLGYAIRHARQLAKLIGPLPHRPADEVPALIEWKLAPGGPSITPAPISVDAVKQLTTVGIGLRDRSTLWTRPVAGGARPAFNPGSVRDRMAGNPRGLDIISTWLAEDGRTPEFVEFVNQIVQRDQSIGPTIDGLVDAALLFAALAGASLGSTIEAVVPAVLGPYARFGAAGLEQTDAHQ